MTTMAPTAPPPSPPRAGPPPPANPPRVASPRPGAASGSGRAVAPPKIGLPSDFATGNRIVVMGGPGMGKTTFAAYAPKPLVLMAPDELGYLTLARNGRVPAVPCAVIDSWPELLSIVRSVASDGDYRTIVLDAVGGFDRMCQEHVCNRDFKGDWSGFASYGKGHARSLDEWCHLLAALEACVRAGQDVILLAHVTTNSAPNPLGEDFLRWGIKAHKAVSETTINWADAVLEFAREFFVKDGKAVASGQQRVCRTVGNAASPAKNRYGLPELIELPDDPASIYYTIDSYMKGAEEGAVA